MKDFVERSFDLAPRVKIVGEELIVDEVIKKERQQINVLTQTIVRRTVKHVVFECGHMEQKQCSTPKKYTTCLSCGKELAQKEASRGKSGQVPEGDARLTANVKIELHTRLKIEAAKRRIYIGDLLEELIENHIPKI